MHAQKKKKVFLLGGGDLEMKTIKDILKKSSDYVMVDKDLKWDDALLSKYAEELVQYSSDDYKIYGIELRADITVPKNYIRIDHHNDLQNMPSALEQIAKIIQHELTDEEKLIVANDKGYYPGMKEYLDKTYPEMTEEDKKCMMYEIRKRDRAAQGVTEEQEEKAKEFYMYSENTDFATFVQVNKDIPFSSIADALWPYERLVIYNKEKTNLCFYGKEALEILEYISKKTHKRSDNYFYSGGGPNGYWGVNKGLLSPEEIDKMVQEIKNFNKSQHMFSFPFIWNNEQINLDEIATTGPWKIMEQSPDTPSIYNEKNYYYKFVHEKLYDDPTQGASQMLHYVREIGDNARYNIQVGGTEYELKIVSIEMKLYQTGVGVLVYKLLNNSPKYNTPDDILKINQYGRRVFPPFFADIKWRSETARSITVSGLKVNNEEFEIKEDFTNYALDCISWKAGNFIDALIKDFHADFEYEPVIDDRMFVMSWYKNTSLVKNAVANYSRNDHFWYKYLYVDAGSLTCQDAEMRENLIKEHTYRRWADWNTLYGITRYSMVMLTSDDVPSHLLNSFTTLYAGMVQLVLMQRASVLKFQRKVNDISRISNTVNKKYLYEKTERLCSEYISFKNQFYFKEVTAQEQGIELYDMLQKSFRLDVMVKDLDQDIQELYQYNSIIEERDSNVSATFLNTIMGIFTPAAFFVSILAYDKCFSENYKSGWGILGVSFFLGMSFCWVLHKWVVPKWLGKKWDFKKMKL